MTRTPIAGCDCCDKIRPLYHGTAAGGIETWACYECHGWDADPYEDEIVPSMCEPPDEQRRQAEERRRLDDVASRSGDEIIAKQKPGIRPDSGGEWNFKHNKMGWA